MGDRREFVTVAVVCALELRARSSDQQSAKGGVTCEYWLPLFSPRRLRPAARAGAGGHRLRQRCVRSLPHDHRRSGVRGPARHRTGKRYLFDDPGCLAAFAASGRVAADVHSIWLNDHANPETHVKAEDAFFVVSDRIKAPMNGHMVAFASRDDAAALHVTVGGTIGRWADIGKRGGS